MIFIFVLILFGIVLFILLLMYILIRLFALTFYDCRVFVGNYRPCILLFDISILSFFPYLKL